MQHTDLPIPLWVFYDEMRALSAKYGEDIYGTKVAGDEDRCYLDVGDWGSAHSEPVLRALVDSSLLFGALGMVFKKVPNKLIGLI